MFNNKGGNPGTTSLLQALSLRQTLVLARGQFQPVDICTLFATMAGAALWKFEVELVQPRLQLAIGGLSVCRRVLLRRLRS